MMNLSFRVLDTRVETCAAVPTLTLPLRIEAVGGPVVESIALRCQIRIEPHRRRYSSAEEERLLELFGETPRWGDTLKPFLWTHASTIVPGFTGETTVDLPVACSYDLEVAAAKYFHALSDGEIPMLLLFSGTVFVRGASGLYVEPVPWDREASFRLPVRVWREVMDAYYPGSAWLRLSRENVDKLMKLKARRAIATWDDVIAMLLRDQPGGEARANGETA
ncbi:MAG TPA: DUF6084 family protein [Polyangiaceae bacterium]|jgi:hypothetical protein